MSKVVGINCIRIYTYIYIYALIYLFNIIPLVQTRPRKSSCVKPSSLLNNTKGGEKKKAKLIIITPGSATTIWCESAFRRFSQSTRCKWSRLTPMRSTSINTRRLQPRNISGAPCGSRWDSHQSLLKPPPPHQHCLVTRTRLSTPCRPSPPICAAQARTSKTSFVILLHLQRQQQQLKHHLA